MSIYWHWKRVRQEREAAYLRLPLPETIEQVEISEHVAKLI